MTPPRQRAAEAHTLMTAIEAACRRAGLAIDGIRPIDYGEQLRVSDGSAAATINVYGGKAGVRTVVGGGRDARLLERLNRLVEESAAPRAAPAAKRDTPESDGSGKSPAPRRARVPAASRFPAAPWIGSDESGKGDYFGPLVAAAVYVGPDDEPSLRTAGVRDSKLLEDAAARWVAAEVRRLCQGRFAEHVLVPAAYNAAYAALKLQRQNLNHLLADGHVGVLDALLADAEVPAQPPPTVIADQFANERHVRERLLAAVTRRGAPMPALLQVPRAEANVAVAAASILARDRFLGWLDEAAVRYGITLPKGGSKPSIIAAARRLVERDGEGALGDVAKLHFATTRQVYAAR